MKGTLPLKRSLSLAVRMVQATGTIGKIIRQKKGKQIVLNPPPSEGNHC